MARGAAVSVLKELRSEEENDDSSYRVKFRERLVKTYKIALLAAESPDVWQEICDDTDWEGFKQAPKHDDQRDALRYVVRLFVGFGGPAATKKASKYYNSLKPWFEGQAPASAVRNALELEGGIEKLAQNAAVAQQVSDSSPPGISIQLSGSRAKKLRDYPAGTRVRITIDLQNTSSPSVVGRVRSLKKATGSRGSKRKPRIELPPL